MKILLSMLLSFLSFANCNLPKSHEKSEVISHYECQNWCLYRLLDNSAREYYLIYDMENIEKGAVSRFTDEANSALSGFDDSSDFLKIYQAMGNKTDAMLYKLDKLSKLFTVSEIRSKNQNQAPVSQYKCK